MAFSKLLHQVAEITRPGSPTYDDYGNATATFETVEGQEAVPCRIQENQGSEDLNDRDTLVRSATGFFDGAVDLQPFDRVIVGSDTWEVNGTPAPRHAARGLHHYEAALRLVAI